MEGEGRKSPHLEQYRFAPGQSGNNKGKPPGTVTRKTILRQILDIKVKDKSELMTMLRERYPQAFTEKAKTRSLEELVTQIHMFRGMFEPGADNVRIDILNRIHGKPIQAVMSLDYQTPPEEQMTTAQTREALEHLQALRRGFEEARSYKPSKPTDDDGDQDQP